MKYKDYDNFVHITHIKNMENKVNNEIDHLDFNHECMITIQMNFNREVLTFVFTMVMSTVLHVYNLMAVILSWVALW